MGVSTWVGPVESENGFIPVNRDENSGISTPKPFDIGIGPSNGNNINPNAGADNVSLRRASTILDMDVPSVPFGVGVPANATNYFMNKIGGTIQTTILLDLGAGYTTLFNNPFLPGGTVIAADQTGTTTNPGYIGFIELPTNGFPLKIEMVCIETPIAGTPFIDLVCSTSAAPYQGEQVPDPTEIINGTEWVRGRSGRSDGGFQFASVKPYLYLVTGAVSDAGIQNYSAGKFWIQITGANIDGTTP